MHVMALPQGWRRLSLADLPREGWRNGAGWTRPVASAELDGETQWRVSLAEISQAAPFSRFEGLDRTAVLAAGGPVHLHSPDHHWALNTPGDVARFPGEAELHNDPTVREAWIWNVMARRDRMIARVDIIKDLQGSLTVPVHGVVLVWVLHGSLLVSNAAGLPLTTLEAQDGLLGGTLGNACADDTARLTLMQASATSRFVFTHITPLT